MEIPGSLTYLVPGLVASLLGTIPFGPINLAVVKITVDYDQRRGMQVAIAAALVEILQVLIAIWFGMVISRFLETNTVVKLVIACVFIVLAVFIATQKSGAEIQKQTDAQQAFFSKGLFIAAINPQAVPFWIFALAALSQSFQFEYAGINLLAFLGGVFVGKIMALGGFVVASGYLQEHFAQSRVLVNRILAAVLFFIGIRQLYSALSPAWSI